MFKSKENRFGIFCISLDSVDNMTPMDASKIFEGMIILRAEVIYCKKTIEYHAWCEHFEIVEDGMCPEYQATIQTNQEDGSIEKVTWDRKKVTFWNKVE